MKVTVKVRNEPSSHALSKGLDEEVLWRRRRGIGRRSKPRNLESQSVQSGGLSGGWLACEVAMTVWLLESGDESNPIERVLERTSGQRIRAAFSDINFGGSGDWKPNGREAGVKLVSELLKNRGLWNMGRKFWWCCSRMKERQKDGKGEIE